jgi:type IV secretory pathway VirB10-like protein
MNKKLDKLLAPDAPSPGIPLKKSTLAVLGGVALVALAVGAIVMDANAPPPAPPAPAPTEAKDVQREKAAKLDIDQERKKAQEAVEAEERKNGVVKPAVEPGATPLDPRTNAAGTTPATSQAARPPAGTPGGAMATPSNPKGPLPPDARRTDAASVPVDKPSSKYAGNANKQDAGGSDRQQEDFQMEAQVRSARSVAFDEGPTNAAAASPLGAASLLNNPAGAVGRAASASINDLLANAATTQAPSASMPNPNAALLSAMRNGQPATPVRNAGGGNSDVNWVNDYAAGGAQKTNDAIKAYPTASPFTLHQGKIIPAVLGRQINSDLPGEITAYVVSNVYDSLGKGALLIPKGSVLVGRYNSEVKPGQERVLFAFNRLIMPNGQSFDLPGAQGSDLSGASGITGDVNNHFFKMFGASFFTAWLGNQVTPQTSTNGLNGVTTTVSPAGQVLVDVSKTILDRNRTIPPTITVDQGARLNVEVKKDMEFSGPYSGSLKP